MDTARSELTIITLQITARCTRQNENANECDRFLPNRSKQFKDQKQINIRTIMSFVYSRTVNENLN